VPPAVGLGQHRLFHHALGLRLQAVQRIVEARCVAGVSAPMSEHGQAEVVKPQDRAATSALPLVPFTPVVTVAV